MNKGQVISVSLLALAATLYVAPSLGHNNNITDTETTNNTTETKQQENINNSELLLDIYSKTFSVINPIVIPLYKPEESKLLTCIRTKTNNESKQNSIKEIEWCEGWLNSDSNIRIAPDINSEIITVLSCGEKIEYLDFNEEWYGIRHNDQMFYIHKELVSNEEIVPRDYTVYSAPENGLKSYMPYQAITSKSSPQYKLQQIAYTGNYGVRQVNGRYCVAIGSAYTTEIGTYFDLVLENGSVIPCILGDQKADEHTDSSNRISADGSLAEFIVNKSSLNHTVKQMGSLSYACEEWNSPIKEVIIYDNAKESY